MNLILKEGGNMITALATVVMAIATVFLAIFTWQSNKLTREIKRTNDLNEAEDKEFKQRVSDLYQAIVISNIVTAPGMPGQIKGVIDTFKAHYKGKTVIFDK
jgi:hypothetical protein